MLIYCIQLTYSFTVFNCTQYLVWAPFALITALIRRGMEVISLWHCWGGMEAQVSLTVAFGSSTFFGKWWSEVGFQKTQWTNTSRCTPNHHRLWKLNTGLQATWAMSFSTLPPDSRTWFPNEIQNLLSSEKTTLDHWQQSSSSSP